MHHKTLVGIFLLGILVISGVTISPNGGIIPEPETSVSLSGT